MKKFLITGGNQGLGQHLVQHYQGVSASRSSGHDINNNRQDIADMSLNFDVFVNNAYDGVFGESLTAYGQVQLLTAVAMLWKEKNKTGHIINIGGVGSEDTGAPFPGWETYNANKAALKHHSLQWTQAFRQNQVAFRTSLITVDRLDTPAGRERSTWTGNGVASTDVATMIDLCLNTQNNTCVGEIVTWVNLDYK